MKNAFFTVCQFLHGIALILSNHVIFNCKVIKNQSYTIFSLAKSQKHRSPIMKNIQKPTKIQNLLSDLVINK